MSRWIDITTDTSKKYYNAFTKRVEMPEYVKNAQVLTSEDAESINSNSFADEVSRKFAMNTKANCWCSALYFYGNQCNNSAVGKQAEANLARGARIWGIEGDVEQIKTAFAIVEVPVTYAMSFEHQGRLVNRCPDNTKAAATSSVEWLYENRFHFPLATQKQAAAILVGKADMLKLDIAESTYVDRLLNQDNYGNLNCKIATAITDRLTSIKSNTWAELEDTLLKFATSLNVNPFDLCQDANTLVPALEAFDIKHKLNTKWGTSIQHPLDVCLRANLTKVAAETESTVYLTTGTPVNMAKISTIQLEKGLKVAGDDFLTYCQTDGLNVDRAKAAEILPTMPKPEAHRFESAIKSAGYNPETHYTLIDRLFDKESGTSEAIQGGLLGSKQTGFFRDPNFYKKDIPEYWGGVANDVWSGIKGLGQQASQGANDVIGSLKRPPAGAAEQKAINSGYRDSLKDFSRYAQPANPGALQPGESDGAHLQRLDAAQTAADSSREQVKQIEAQADQADLDIEAARAQAAADQARRANIVNPNTATPVPQQ